MTMTIRRTTKGRSNSGIADDNNNNEQNRIIQDIISTMTLQQKIGQMSQIEINMLVTDDKSTLNQTKLDYYIGELGIGSVLNNIVPTPSAEGEDDGSLSFWTTSQYRKAAIQIQDTVTKYNNANSIPVIWGLDSVHGCNYIIGKISTPQPINIASTFNITVSKLSGYYASYNTRQGGINWLFSPLLGISYKSSYWSRIYETFSEDPYLTGIMAYNMIYGIQQQQSQKQGSDKDIDMDSTIVPSLAAACGKHFVGYSLPHNGHDRAPSWIPKRHLYQYFVLPWKYVLVPKKRQQQDDSNDDNNVNSNNIGIPKTIMESYTEILMLFSSIFLTAKTNVRKSSTPSHSSITRSRPIWVAVPMEL